MQLTVLGLNHRTAPVEIRERFNFSNDRVASILRRLRNYDNIPEAMLLSTCNRTELYMVIENPHEAIPFIKTLLKHLAGEHYQSEYFYNLSGTNCVKHLFRVASSLDSLIVGEGQILSQIKNAYQIARANGMTDTILNTIMNKAIAVGKRVRTETKIAYSSVSVSSAAVDLAIKILGDLSKAQILVVGAGHMSELTAQHLLDKGAQTICVSNRHYERAQDLAGKFHGTAIPYRAMFEHAADADIIITSTGAPHYVLTVDNLGPLLPKRNGKLALILDVVSKEDKLTKKDVKDFVDKSVKQIAETIDNYKKDPETTASDSEKVSETTASQAPASATTHSKTTDSSNAGKSNDKIGSSDSSNSNKTDKPSNTTVKPDPEPKPDPPKPSDNDDIDDSGLSGPGK